MLIVGLTGGIASGKNFVADIFAKKGAAIFDADKEVHNLMESDKSAISAVAEKFPDSFFEGKINRSKLSELIFVDDDSYQEKIEILEKIFHPRVRDKYDEFLKKSDLEGKKIVVLNIPLLLETKSYDCDKIIAIIVEENLRKRRFLERAKSSKQSKTALEKKFQQVLSRQINNEQRKLLADFIVDNNGSKIETEKQVLEVISQL